MNKKEYGIQTGTRSDLATLEPIITVYMHKYYNKRIWYNLVNGLRQSRFRFKFYKWYGVHTRRFIYKTLSISNINMDAEESSRYISWAVSKLKQELIAREATTRGRKTDLIERYYTQLWFEWKSLIIVDICNQHSFVCLCIMKCRCKSHCGQTLSVKSVFDEMEIYIFHYCGHRHLKFYQSFAKNR